jgi:hypothetical protein
MRWIVACGAAAIRAGQLKMCCVAPLGLRQTVWDLGDRLRKALEPSGALCVAQTSACKLIGKDDHVIRVGIVTPKFAGPTTCRSAASGASPDMDLAPTSPLEHFACTTTSQNTRQLL